MLPNVGLPTDYSMAQSLIAALIGLALCVYAFRVSRK